MSQPKRKEETVGVEMKGEEALAYVLNDIGLTKVFTTYSLPNIVKEMLKKYNIEVDFSISVKDASWLAYAYAMENNSVGTIIQIPGSKLTDAVDVIAQAYMESVPLLIISSVRSHKDTGRARIGEFRTIDDLSNILSPIIKTKERVISIEEITVTIEKAYKEAVSNRPRPSYVEISEDLFRAKAYPLSTAGQKPEKRTPDKNSVAKVAELLTNAKLPVIIAGYGVVLSDAEDMLVELAELIDSPVVTTFKAKGSIPSNHKLFAGEGLGAFSTSAANYLIENADVILALGTRFTQLSTAGWSLKYKGILVHNNVDGEDIGKVFMPHVPIVADTGLFLRELLTQLKAKIKEKINRGASDIIYKTQRQAYPITSHNDIWPIDVVKMLSSIGGFEKVYVDISATTIDLVRLPINAKKTWYTAESLLERGIAVGGIIASKYVAYGITDIEGILPHLSLLKYKMDKIKGKLIILNDGGANYIEVSNSDLPTIARSQTSFNANFDEIAEKALGGVTVNTLTELEEALKSVDKKIINVKIDPNFESVILSRI
ncbi:thiamine pyrophosphate-binding protein [Saccharolobus solfataricus]|nr:thiamine pyrophosphate-binding protein [Saccharolobus solfataricus]AKA73496.1 thiamine pyrophosphate-binding protein [Saccharolobus solfataricus]AKA76194.1 thiamine pyrophosphate-binding protein [Saccharolobus solfataricus]AKA78886.1 thiamine pyrophosphate-binding protein [Saccharolobus solfataricus]AZF67963.1 thiamine pyrophosphate-binding protein [Saccharolobus solfataricus]AZF70583.1 thiamine pyrophosphate-binding protein [Saccharolobus solfataricus]